MPRSRKKRSPLRTVDAKQLDRESGEQTTSSGVEDTTSVRTESGSDRNLPRALIVNQFSSLIRSLPLAVRTRSLPLRFWRGRTRAMTATAVMIRPLLHSTILRGQCGEDQKEQRVSGGVQSEIEKAVDQNGEAAGQRAGSHSATKLVVSFAAGKALAEENHDEGQAE